MEWREDRRHCRSTHAAQGSVPRRCSGSAWCAMGPPVITAALTHAGPVQTVVTGSHACGPLSRDRYSQTEDCVRAKAAVLSQPLNQRVLGSRDGPKGILESTDTLWGFSWWREREFCLHFPCCIVPFKQHHNVQGEEILTMDSSFQKPLPFCPEKLWNFPGVWDGIHAPSNWSSGQVSQEPIG